MSGCFGGFYEEKKNTGGLVFCRIFSNRGLILVLLFFFCVMWEGLVGVLANNSLISCDEMKKVK